mmetsp:Transcript_77271/g.94753  ORF Transcript_77271/g.94753 Transcript_77271/m.94753 type:complete len:650 (+) Transcript_77271:87-2036(+)
MCFEVKCQTCGKRTWAGCGLHKDRVMKRIPKKDQCVCRQNKSNNDDDVKDNNKAMEFDSDDEDNNAGYVDANIAARTGSINDDVIRQDEEVEPYQLWETQIKEIIIDIFTKNYPFLFFCFIFGLSIGFIVYIFTTKKWYMTILSIVSIIAGLLYDEYHFKDKRKADGNPLKWKPYDQTVDDGSTEPWRKSNDDEFYIESKFYSRTTGKQRGVTRIYRKANTHALTIQTRFGNEEYAGFEIGGGIAYIVGIPVFVVAFLGTDLLTAILGVYFALVLAGLVGCLIEMSLRKWGWLHPLGYRQTRTQSFALHEIAHVDTYTVGLHKTIRRLRQTSWIFEIISWFFYAVSFILLSPVFIVKYMIKFIYLNPIFLLWLFHFVATMILFEIQYIKESDPLKALAWLLPFNFLFSLYCLYLFASSKPEFTCNARFGCKLKQILYTRVPPNPQKVLFILLGVCSFLIFISAVFIITVKIRIYGWFKSGNAFTFSDYSIDVYNALICEETRNSKWIFDVYPNTFNNSYTFNNIYTSDNIYAVQNTSDAAVELCDTVNFELLSTSLLILCIVWYLLLGGWLYMWQSDNIGFTQEGVKTKTWLTYSTVSISLKNYTWYSGTIYIPLTYKAAQKVHDFIVSNAVWYNRETNINNVRIVNVN